MGLNIYESLTTADWGRCVPVSCARVSGALWFPVCKFLGAWGTWVKLPPATPQKPQEHGMESQATVHWGVNRLMDVLSLSLCNCLSNKYIFQKKI